MPCCERCEAAVGIGHDETGSDIRLQEMSMSFGIVTILCFECRKAWAAFNYNHELFKKYSLQGFRFKMWQLKYKRNPFKVEVEEGEKLLQDLERMEPDLHIMTKNWIRAGVSREEMESRGTNARSSDDD